MNKIIRDVNREFILTNLYTPGWVVGNNWIEAITNKTTFFLFQWAVLLSLSHTFSHTQLYSGVANCHPEILFVCLFISYLAASFTRINIISQLNTAKHIQKNVDLFLKW